MGFNASIQITHLLNVQVSEFPQIPTCSIFSFISSSRICPRFRPSNRYSLSINKRHSLSLSSSQSYSPPSISGNFPTEISFEASYLMNTFGFSLESAISKAKYLKFNNTTEKPEKVQEFLKEHGFTDTQISTMVYSFPVLLRSRPETTILPKLSFLSSIGFSRTEITDIVTVAPIILLRSLDNVVVPAYNLLCSLVDSDDTAIELIKRYPKILTHAPEVGNIQILRDVGVPEANIVYSLSHQSRAYLPKVDNYRKIVEEVLKMGFDPTSMKFLRAIRTMRTLTNSSWEHKVQIFKKFGWTDEDILVAFQKDQNFITASEDKIVRVMDFLKRMGVETRAILNWTRIFSMSLEKRIGPRLLVYQTIVEKGLCKRRKKLTMSTLITYPENQFVHEVIKPCVDENPEILDLYQEMLNNSYKLAEAPSRKGK